MKSLLDYYDESGEQDTDISAIYVLGAKKSDLAGPEATEVIPLPSEDGDEEARRKHKEAGDLLMQ